MYWRRFAVSSIPVDDPKAFDDWVLQRWREKDYLLEHYAQHGRFPPSAENLNAASGKSNGPASNGSGYLVTEVKLAHWVEVGTIFIMLPAFGLVANVILKLWRFVISANI